jgi:2-keto-4-pentenoate hydratase/2-oxohepta-3-ene-1,7-dioic acid hydratase in catechol pathway
MGRIREKGTGEVHNIVFVGEEAHYLKGDSLAQAHIGSPVEAFETAEVLPPVMPGKIVCVGLNYLAHVTENDPSRQIPDEPVIFMKPASALLGHQGVIRIANPDHRTDYEAELALVIGKEARNVRPDEALDYVLGYTCANDVSDRVLQKKDGQWVRAKGFDTYCPLGPWIETEIDLDSVVVSSFLNGEPRQSQAVSTMLFPVPVLISFVSKVMTLHPNDVILTGTPEGVGPLQFGDTIEVTVSGVGTLTNTVVA